MWLPGCGKEDAYINEKGVYKPAESAIVTGAHYQINEVVRGTEEV